MLLGGNMAAPIVHVTIAMGSELTNCTTRVAYGVRVTNVVTFNMRCSVYNLKRGNRGLLPRGDGCFWFRV